MPKILDAHLRLSSSLPKKTHSWTAPPLDTTVRQRKHRLSGSTGSGRVDAAGAALPAAHQDSVWEEGTVEHFDRFIAGDK